MKELGQNHKARVVRPKFRPESSKASCHLAQGNLNVGFLWVQKGRHIPYVGGRSRGSKLRQNSELVSSQPRETSASKGSGNRL